MIITFFPVLFAAGNLFTAKYQKLEGIKHIRSSDVDWMEEMRQLQKAIDEYLPNECSRINFDALMSIYSSDEFRDLILTLNDTEFMISLKGLFNYDDKTSYLFEMDRILKKDKIGITPGMNAFLGKIDVEIYNASKWSIENLKYLFQMRGMLSYTNSSEQKSFSNLFVSTIYTDDERWEIKWAFGLDREFISKIKSDLEYQKITKIYIHPKFLFLQNYDTKEYIEQKELENIKFIEYYRRKYNIVGIFLRNRDNNRSAVVMQRNKDWMAFVDGKCYHFDTEFTLPWYVTLVMYEKEQ